MSASSIIRAGLTAILLAGTLTTALAQQAPTPPKPTPSPSPGGCERTPDPIV